PRSIVPLLRTLIGERASLTATNANDAEIERLLKRIPEGIPKEILTAQYLTAKKDAAAARDRLDKALERNPMAMELYSARFQVEIFDRQFAGAKEIIARAGPNSATRMTSG